MKKVYHLPTNMKPLPTNRATEPNGGPVLLFPAAGSSFCSACDDTGEQEVWCPENGKDYIPCEVCCLEVMEG